MVIQITLRYRNDIVMIILTISFQHRNIIRITMSIWYQICIVVTISKWCR